MTLHTIALARLAALRRALVAGNFGYVAAMLGSAVSSTRQFTNQPPLLTLFAFTSAAVLLIAVPAIGRSGSVLAVAAAAAVQIGGNLYILRRAA